MYKRSINAALFFIFSLFNLVVIGLAIFLCVIRYFCLKCTKSRSYNDILAIMYMKKHKNTKLICAWRSQLANNLQRCLDEYEKQKEVCFDLRRDFDLLQDKISLIKRRLQSTNNIGYVQRQIIFQRDGANYQKKKYVREQTERDHEKRSKSSYIARSLLGQTNKQKYQRLASAKKLNKQDQAIYQQKRKNSQQRKRQFDILIKQGYENLKKFNVKPQIINTLLKKQYTQSDSFYYQPFSKEYWKNQKKDHDLRGKIKFVAQHLNFLRHYHQENQQKCKDQYFIDICKDAFFRAKSLLEQFSSVGNTLMDQDWQLPYAFFDSFQKFMGWLYDFMKE